MRFWRKWSKSGAVSGNGATISVKDVLGETYLLPNLCAVTTFDEHVRAHTLETIEPIVIRRARRWLTAESLEERRIFIDAFMEDKLGQPLRGPKAVRLTRRRWYQLEVAALNLLAHSDTRVYEKKAPKSGVQNARQAIKHYCRNKLHPDPSYYSGCGVIETDLGVMHLVLLYQGLVSDFGQETGDAFCRMVRSLADMSATNFLNQFYRFFELKQEWKSPLDESGMDVGSDPNAMELLVGFSISCSAYRLPKQEEIALGEDIKRRFFLKIGRS